MVILRSQAHCLLGTSGGKKKTKTLKSLSLRIAVKSIAIAMMVGASKLFMLLSSPFPLRLARHSRVSLVSLSASAKRRFSSNSRTRLGFSIRASENFHSQTSSVTREDHYADPPPNSRVSHPWPEWSKLVENLRSSGYFDGKLSSLLHGEDAFSMFDDLPEEFVQAASACLSFARKRPDLLRSLSRKDIEIVVENGSPFMFKSAVDSARRMKVFLGSHRSNDLELENVHTVDLMRFLLSYSCNPTVSHGNNFNNWGIIESSVRNLLGELADASRSVQDLDLSGSLQNLFPDRYRQTPRHFGQNIEMKRGDWICPKCSFMNFARNMKCLECDEARPKKQLSGGEWECPQCNFFNYGRNVVCIRCDCKHPKEVSFGTADSRSGLGYNNENKADIESARKTPLEPRLADAQYRVNFSNDGTPEKNGFRAGNGMEPAKASDTSIGRSLDTILGRTSAVSDTDNSLTAAIENTSSISSSSSPQYRQSVGSKSDYVPFKPLPADMFAKRQKSKMEEQLTGNDNIAYAKANEKMSSPASGKSDDSSLFSKKPVNQTESREDKEQAEKSERWFKKVAELHDVTDLASAISDEDFPEIMPMRKGENRFVVSKKDRSLTSPQYKRRMAMEQANNTNFVPFVPFPPDYFAKKDKQTETGSSTDKAKDGTAATSATPEILGVSEKLEEGKSRVPDSVAGWNSMQQPDSQRISKERSNKSFYEKSLNESNVNFAGNSTERSDDRRTSNRESWNGNTVSSTRISNQQQESPHNSREGWKGGFSGKSLEGSLVKEPDPLDMSEEAKAERWFRRAAQIKDISELSQIPDEDFPEIMPMRKGVNRFVVSKRKTPLERRLTSPQYRRNLPIVSSEPVKENNES